MTLTTLEHTNNENNWYLQFYTFNPSTESINTYLQKFQLHSELYEIGFKGKVVILLASIGSETCSKLR